MYTKEYALQLLTVEGEKLEALYREADRVRQARAGSHIFLRGIIEFSNNCSNDCLYCGIRASNRGIERYVMSADEIAAAVAAIPAEITTVVLQAGESQAISDEDLGRIIRRIKTGTNLAVTVSVGNRRTEVYRYWRECGMDRYLLRFETSDASLFKRIHPDCTLSERLACLKALRQLGVQVGSGFLIGLPGETIDTLAGNILLCREHDLDMIGIGPFIPHPGTPLGREENAYARNPEIFFKALAALRIFNPDAHIPATTAYDALFPQEGRNLCLKRGANVYMPNVTPLHFRRKYQLYPGKPFPPDSGEECWPAFLQELGRPLGKGPGHSLKKRPAGVRAPS